MVKRVQILGHDTAGADAFIGRIREVTVVTTNSELRVHDGSTAGGTKIALASLSNVPAATTSVDGKMSAADKLKLDNIENSATADQTGAEIKSLYEAEADTNAFTDALLTKLNGIEATADVTDATNVNAAGAVMESDYNANTLLVANADNTPLPLTVAASRILGRKSSGDVAAMTAAEAKTVLAIANTDVSGLGSLATLSSVNFAQMTAKTQGELIIYGASGVPEALGVGTAGQILKSAGAGANVFWGDLSLAILQDQKPDGTEGGTRTAGSWLIRDINTEVYDPDGIVSISANQFTLIAGTYHIHARSIAMLVTASGFRTRIFNASDSTVAGLSDSMAGGQVTIQVTNHESTIDCAFTIATSKTFELQYFSQDTRANDGLGNDDFVTAGVEVYATIVINKLG